MYKVFFNDSTIQFGSETKKSFKNNINEESDFDDYDSVNQFVRDAEFAENPFDFYVGTRDVEMVWKHFKSYFTEIPAAGGLVKKNSDDLLFIKRLALWDLPKGKIEKDETPEDAAIREVEEECGLTGLQLVRQLDSTFHIYRSPYIKLPDNLVLKETRWFLMNYSGDENPVPQSEENIEEVRWIRPEELDMVMKNTYSSLREFLKNNLPFI